VEDIYQVPGVGTVLSGFVTRGEWKKGEPIHIGPLKNGTTVFFLGARFGRIRWKRFTQAVDVPSVHFGPKAPWLRGRVVSVSDGDTFRFYHILTPFHSTILTLKKGQKMSKLAMPIRICTMDAPETPRFGKRGQPFALEAKEELKKLIDGKIIQIRLLLARRLPVAKSAIGSKW
jgi:hypothetical protein